MDRKQPRFNSAHVIALIALFVALAGTSFAAVKLGKNAVKTKSIANKAVTGKKLADGAVTNVKVAKDSLDADRLTPAARSSLSAPPTLYPAGTTVKGAYSVQFTASAGGEIGADSVSYGSAFSSAPGAIINLDGQPVDPNCAGGSVADPKANPGFLCFFESVGINRNVGLSTGTTVGNFVSASSAAAGAVQSTGTWAATAP